jgi:hypothetical protein
LYKIRGDRTYPIIQGESTGDIHSRYDLEDACGDWYMYNCNFWENNYFELLFDESTPPYVENIVVGSQEPIMTTNLKLSYSLVVVWYVDYFLDMDGSIYLDPHDYGRHLECFCQPTIELRYLRRGLNMRTRTWELVLWMSTLESYFSITIFTHTWDTSGFSITI